MTTANRAPVDTAPEWLDHTPLADEPPYLLMIWNRQEIELLSDEYIALKEHLAQLRGYVKPAAPEPLPIETKAELSAAPPPAPAEQDELSAIVKRLHRLPVCRLDLVDTFITLVSNYTGSTSPFETFVIDLLRGYPDESPTPDEIDLSEFREDFDLMKNAATTFMRQHRATLEKETINAAEK